MTDEQLARIEVIDAAIERCKQCVLSHGELSADIGGMTATEFVQSEINGFLGERRELDEARQNNLRMAMMVMMDLAAEKASIYGEF